VADRLAAVRARTRAAQEGIPFVELGSCTLDPDAVRAIPLDVLKRLGAVPYRLVDGVLHVAVAESSPSTLAELQLAGGNAVAFALAPEHDIAMLLHELGRGGTLANEELRFEGELASDSPAIRTVNEIIRCAAVARASDVHFIPDNGFVHVRFRIDGVVQEHSVLPPEEVASVIARLKVVAKLDLAEHRRAQDGRFSVRTTVGRIIDVRITVLPTVSGEGVVLRLLQKTPVAPSLTDLGLANSMQMELERIVDRAIGALLVTGPTGSGKSTTVYAALADLARPERTLITIEDPVEYELPGTYQLQTNTAVGVTFAVALRSMLRGDPDVLMVGEIRDAETASLALGASLAGHFLLSTLHTNDAPSAITRLIEMGVEPYVVSAGLAGVMGQRLARKLCLYCRQPYTPSAEVLATLRPDGVPSDGATFFRARGCSYCSSGYRGRVGIFQLLTVGDELRKLIAGGAPNDAIVRAAQSAGMASLWEDGLAKVEAGMTSLEELHRVVPR
jgi:type II secretory ATPase GspE/PulE/Tfp pilus assembly ATPase PilB-like protein